MLRQGFDNEKYIKTQSKEIKQRIAQFGGKLYLEFGGKLFDDYHASRVLPGFEPDSKLKMLLEMKDQAEIIIVINSNDIENAKVRGDLGITYEQDVLRLIDIFRGYGERDKPWKRRSVLLAGGCGNTGACNRRRQTA